MIKTDGDEFGNTTISFKNACEVILRSVAPLGFEEVSILEASGRILYQDIVSDMMIPSLDDSAMDGYAIISEDTKGATNANPVLLEIIGEIQAGQRVLDKTLKRGTAIRIMTGAPIPQGADSVIPVEHIHEDKSLIKIFREVAPYESYRFAGESIKKGEIVLSSGKRLNSADIGVLASLNYRIVKVYRQPRVSIISTGDELADVGEDIRFGQIRNVNAYTLYSEVKRCSCLPDYLGIARDTYKDTEAVFLRALESDVVISTGGVSAGKYDFVRQILDGLGIAIQFERVNVKPGTPCAFGTKNDKLFFGLPGNPVPVLTSFLQFVRPALLRLMGAKKVERPLVGAILEQDINSGKAYHLARGCFTLRNGDFYVTPTSHQKPSMLRSMSDANCLIIIPENVSKAKAGDRVTIQLIEHEEI